MADDSLEIIKPHDYHPCDTPRGCTYYDIKILTDCQQLKLNQLKLATIKSDEQYLKAHPEIRGFVALITRHIFMHQPRRDIPALIKEFFTQPRWKIEEELANYLQDRPVAEEEVVGEGLDEETHFKDDYKNYLNSLQPPLEEKSKMSIYTKASTDEISIDDFIRQLLKDRIRTFPSKPIVPPPTSKDNRPEDSDTRSTSISLQAAIDSDFRPTLPPVSIVSLLENPGRRLPTRIDSSRGNIDFAEKKSKVRISTVIETNP